MDNAGENMNIRESLTENGLETVKVEYKAPRTPQHNGHVERGFGSLFGCLRAILNGLNLDLRSRDKFWDEEARFVTMMDNMVVRYDGECPDEKFEKEGDPEFVMTLGCSERSGFLTVTRGVRYTVIKDSH